MGWDKEVVVPQAPVYILRLAVCSITGFLHQLDGLFGTRFYSAFESFGSPGVVKVNICRNVDRWLQGNIPNGSIVELNFGYLGIPIFVQDRADVKHKKYASDDEVHCPES